MNLDDRVPIYVGANGPKALAATGAYGDGRVSAGTEPTRVMQNNMERVAARGGGGGPGAAARFPHLGADVCLCLKAGESLGVTV